MDRIEKIKEFLKDSPADSFLKHALALEYVKAGNDAKAKKLFAEILQEHQDYVGSYYHLGKLLERNGNELQAVEVYAKGMQVAQAAGDQHALNELRAAWEDLTY